MMTARTVMAESGLGGRFWFKAAKAGKDTRNVTFKERIGMSPYQAMYGEKKDVSGFRAFGCRARFQSIRLQGLGISRQASSRERKAHAESQRGNIR